MLKSLKHKAQIAGRLSLLDWLAFAEAWWGLLAFHLILRVTSYQRLSRMTYPIRSEVVLLSSQLDAAGRWGRLVALSSRLHFLPMTCLVKAMTLRWILGRRGVQSDLRLGANKTLDGIHAHAWVEVQGQAIGEPADIDSNFQVLASRRGTSLQG